MEPQLLAILAIVSAMVSFELYFSFFFLFFYCHPIVMSRTSTLLILNEAKYGVLQ